MGNRRRPGGKFWGCVRAGAAVAAAILWAGPGAAQSLNFSTGGANTPVEIFAENGIEWQQDGLVFLARGNARAVRGDVAVRADVLKAYYRQNKDGGTDIWRLDAEGKVRVSSPGETAFGEKGVYDVENAILVLSGGKRVRLVTGTDKISARKQLEYWEKKQMAVARGDAVAVRGEKRLRAEILAAYFHKNAQGKTVVYRVEAFQNVRVDTDKDRARSDRAVYNVESGIATLLGSVKITRGPNQLNGCSAQINLNTGISKLFSCAPAAGGGKRVHGVFTPGKPVKKK